MIRFLAVSFFLVNSFFTLGQSKGEVLKSLEEIDVEGDFGYYELRYNAWKPKIRDYPNIDYNNYENIVRAKIGDIVYENDKKSNSSFIHKIIKKENRSFNQVKYLYLNGEMLSKLEIDSLRSRIITEYYNGSEFDELFKEYNMDGNDSSVLTWLDDEDKFVQEFVDEAKKYKKGDIYTVDVIKNNWYYVCLKIEDTKFVEVTKTIKILYNENQK